MSAYQSQYPGIEVKLEIKQFFEKFYQISDTADAHEQYADSFTPDGTLIMASAKLKGRDEIIGLRHKMWEKVASRKHKPVKVFPFGPDSDEVMLYGTVEYGKKDGGSNTIDWAARAHLVKQGSDMKMDFYQVYLDTAAQK